MTEPRKFVNNHTLFHLGEIISFDIPEFFVKLDNPFRIKTSANIGPLEGVMTRMMLVKDIGFSISLPRNIKTNKPVWLEKRVPVDIPGYELREIRPVPVVQEEAIEEEKTSDIQDEYVFRTYVPVTREAEVDTITRNAGWQRHYDDWEKSEEYKSLNKLQDYMEKFDVSHERHHIKNICSVPEGGKSYTSCCIGRFLFSLLRDSDLFFSYKQYYKNQQRNLILTEGRVSHKNDLAIFELQCPTIVGIEIKPPSTVLKGRKLVIKVAQKDIHCYCIGEERLSSDEENTYLFYRNNSKMAATTQVARVIKMARDANLKCMFAVDTPAYTPEKPLKMRERYR